MARRHKTDTRPVRIRPAVALDQKLAETADRRPLGNCRSPLAMPLPRKEEMHFLCFRGLKSWRTSQRFSILSPIWKECMWLLARPPEIAVLPTFTLELVRLHIHAPPAEAHAFGLQPEALLDGRIAAQLDLSAR